MFRMKKTYIFLTGGLGNQIFQWAAGISRANGDDLVLDFGIGRPRLNKYGKPDISDFNVGADSKIRYCESDNWFFRKFSGYALRQGLAPTRIEKNLRLQRVTSIVLGLCLFFRYGHFVKVVQATDNGFFEMNGHSRSEYLVGYFQSYRWAELPSVDWKLKSLELLKPSAQLNSFIQDNSNRDTLLVHVRLGDYKKHDNFGIPVMEYYKQAITEIAKHQQFERILLFSNEPDLALAYIPADFHAQVFVVPDFDGSASETLEAMRHAKNYVIGNSSLSWWGARLSHSVNPRIIAPNPWFKSEPEPRDLIPLEWTRINAFDNK